jgi:hypothetical protein
VISVTGWPICCSALNNAYRKQKKLKTDMKSCERKQKRRRKPTEKKAADFEQTEKKNLKKRIEKPTVS